MSHKLAGTWRLKVISIDDAGDMGLPDDDGKLDLKITNDGVVQNSSKHTDKDGNDHTVSGQVSFLAGKHFLHVFQAPSRHYEVFLVNDLEEPVLVMAGRVGKISHLKRTVIVDSALGQEEGTVIIIRP